MSNRRTFTSEEKRELLAKVKQSVKDGMTISDACREHGIHDSQWYTWQGHGKGANRGAVAMKPKARRKKSVPTMATIPVFDTAADTGGNVFMFYGAPDKVAALVARLA
jgi:transposase-like protein